MESTPRPANLPVGTRVAGRYRIKERLGQGSSGVVYRARHEELRRDFALKLLNPEVELERRPRLSSFRHRYAVPLREGGKDRELGLRYLVMDIVEGRSLAEVLRSHALRPESAVRLARQVLAALEHAHRAGLVHRDLKPSKLLLTEVEQGREEVRVLGFGLAEAINPESMGGDVEEVLRRAEMLRRKVVARDPRLKTTTRLKPLVQLKPGKRTDFEDLTYMSPELLLGRPYDGRADIYAVGAILYEALSRRRPFEVDARAIDPVEDLKLQIEGDPPRDLAEIAPRVPPALCAEVMRSLSKSPFDRHPSAVRFRRAIREALERVALKNPAGVSEVGEPLKVKAVARGGKPDPDEEPPESGRPQVKISLPSGSRCPSCHKRLTETGTVRCAECQAIHHAHCFRVRAECAECGHDDYEGEGPIRIEPIDHGSRSGLFRLFVFTSLAVAAVVAVLLGLQGGFAPPWLKDGRERFLDLSDYSETPPSWYERLGEGERPALLPPGVGYSKTKGEYINKQDGSVLVWIKPGTVTLGKAGEDDTVKIERGYFIGKYEVTWAQFERFCQATKRAPPSKKLDEGIVDYSIGPNHPVFNVSRDDAVAYAEWAGLRLPRRVEFEFAARGTDQREYPWGDEAPTAAHGADSHRTFKTYAVGAHEANRAPSGCLDLYGNVREWLGEETREGTGILAGGGSVVYEFETFPVETKTSTTGFRIAADPPDPSDAGK